MRAEVPGQVGSRTGPGYVSFLVVPVSVSCPESSSMILESGKVCSSLGSLCPQFEHRWTWVLACLQGLRVEASALVSYFPP